MEDVSSVAFTALSPVRPLSWTPLLLTSENLDFSPASRSYITSTRQGEVCPTHIDHRSVKPEGDGPGEATRGSGVKLEGLGSGLEQG